MGSTHATRWYLAVLCFLGAVRIFVGSAGLPLFNGVDEQAHFDLIHKYARGYWPVLQRERYDLETARIDVIYGSPECICKPEVFPGGIYYPPVWTWKASRDRDEYINKRISVLINFRNHEAHSPPVYYLVGAAWYWLGKLLGLNGPFGAYWIRFLNILLYVLLITTAYAFCKKYFSRFIALAVPALAAFFPSTIFFGINADVLSPLIVLLALWFLLKWEACKAPSTGLSLLSGLLVAAAFIAKFWWRLRL